MVLQQLNEALSDSARGTQYSNSYLWFHVSRLFGPRVSITSSGRNDASDKVVFQKFESRPNVLCVQRSRNISVLGSSYDATTVWENGDLIVLEVEPEQELIEPDIPEGL